MIDSFKKYPAFWATLLILGSGALRFWFVASGQLNLVQDEAQYWDWTRHLQLTYYSKGPLIAAIIAFWCKIFGNTELGVRAGSVFGMACSQALLYWGVSRVFKKPGLALLSLAVFTTVPLFMALGILMTTDNSFVFFWMASMFALYSGSIPREPGLYEDEPGEAPTLPFVLLALTLGVGILAKYTMLGFIGLSGLFWLGLLVMGMSPRKFFKKLFLACFCGLVIGFLPTFIWNFMNDFVGYKHVLYLIGVEGKGAQQLIRFDRFPEYFGSQLALATPWWMWFMLAGGFSALAQFILRRPGKLGLDGRQAWLLVVFFLPVWGFFLLWSFHAKVLPNWTTVSYVAGSILAAASFAAFWRREGRRARSVKKFVVWASVVVFVLVNTLHLLPIPDSINPTHRLKGWEQLGEEVQALKQTFPDPDKVFIMTGLYDMNAALAFYVPGQPRTYCAWVEGRRMNQYDMWPGPQDKKGWDVIYVRKGFYPKVPGQVRRMFDSVSEPIELQTEYNGVPARKYTLFKCTGYNGEWPRPEHGTF